MSHRVFGFIVSFRPSVTRYMGVSALAGHRFSEHGGDHRVLDCLCFFREFVALREFHVVVS